MGYPTNLVILVFSNGILSSSKAHPLHVLVWLLSVCGSQALKERKADIHIVLSNQNLNLML